MCIRDSTSGIKQLVDGSNTLVANNAQLNSGASQLADGTNQIVSGVDQLTTGSKTLSEGAHTPVSYTHLDVYKRQRLFICA